MDKQKIFDFCLKTFLFLSPVFFFRQYHLSHARGLFFILGTFALYAVSLSIPQKRNLSNPFLSIILLLGLINVFFKESSTEINLEWFNFWMSCASYMYIFAGVLLFRTVYCYADDIKQYIKPIGFVCFLNALLVLAQLIHKDFMWTNTPSICGFMETSSQLGQYSAMCLPLMALLNPFLAILPLFTLIASKSISPILALTVGMAVFSVRIGVRARYFIITGLILMMAISLNYGYISAKWACRPVMWGKTVKVALQKPFLGHGYRTFHEKVVEIKVESTLGGTTYSRAHNDYAHTAQEAGFPIVIAFGLFIMGMAKKYIKIPVGYEDTMCFSFKALNQNSIHKTINAFGIAVLIPLINMSGQTLIRYASIAGTFIVILALFCIKIDKE